ncbi:hypothetical protein BH09VER1_BH09VER1_17800 [soil metagenome]
MTLSLLRFLYRAMRDRWANSAVSGKWERGILIPLIRGHQIDVRIYAVYCDLDAEDRKYFQDLTERDHDFRTMVEDCAQLWIHQLRCLYPDPFKCRRAFLARAALLGATHSIATGGSRALAAAYGLALTDMVEQRVKEIDLASNDEI